MTRTFKLAAIAAATLIAAPAFAAATMDANLELDTKYGNKNSVVQNGVSQSGRVEFNVAGKAGNDAGFVAGRASFLATKTDGAQIDDMWGQIGTSVADVKFGKFEAADLYPVGKDVYVEDGGSAAGSALGHARTNELRGRFGNSAAHLALTVNAIPGVSFEIGVVESKTVGSAKGIRPAVSFNAGPVAVKLGMETGKIAASGSDKFTGFGGTVGVGVMGGTVNLNFASRTDKLAAGDQKHTSFGLVGVFGAAGVAYINDKDNGVKQNTLYVAYSLPLFATGATITPALSTSKAKGGTSATGGAVRVNYAF